MDGGNSGTGGFGWSSNGGPEAPGPGVPYGWFLLFGGFFVVMTCIGAIVTGDPLILATGVIGLAIVAVGIYERTKGTRAW